MACRITSRDANRGDRSEVVGRAQPPLAIAGDDGVISRVIVEIRDRGIETDACKQLAQVLLRVRTRAPQFIRQRQV